MNPIPATAVPEDPRWERAFLDVAHGLVQVGAKARIISRLIEFPLARIRKLYKALRGMDPPSGPIIQGSARFFTMPGKHISAAWSIQCATFLACYERMGKITDTPVQRGWQLLAAFTVYLSLTEKLYQATRIRRLDINQAYALLTHCGFLAPTGGFELRRRECPTCLIRYPVLTIQALSRQRCPVCTMNANNRRLSRQASRAAHRKHRAKT